MFDKIATILRGTFRLGPATAVQGPGGKGAHLMADGTPVPPDPPWLTEARKLIPGEALASYIALQAIGKAAVHPENVNIFLAITFLIVTIFLRIVGSQDPSADNPKGTIQWDVVIISAISFVALVYSTGGQIFWHKPITDQALYAQIIATALGVIGPSIHKVFSKK